MCWHHKMCKFANYPHPNVLPSMPTRKKTKSRDGENEMTTGEESSSSCTKGTPVQPGEPGAKLENANPSVEVQTEIKLFPGVLSKH